MQLVTQLALVVAFVGLVAYKVFKSFRDANRADAPPGPLQFPLVGRIHDLPKEKVWVKFKQWGDEYAQGGIYRTSMFGDNLIVIVNEKAAEELLVKQARINSDRPLMRSLTDSKSCDRENPSMAYLPLMGKNEFWARQRKMVHASLVEAGKAEYDGVMYTESKRWLASLLARPDQMEESLREMASRVMCRLTWDEPAESDACSDSAWHLLWQMSPAGPVTNLVPALWHLPLWLNPWKRMEISRHAKQQDWWTKCFLATREKMRRGEQGPCWTRDYLAREKSALSGDREAACALGMLATVGVYTLLSPVLLWIIALINHPEWQERVREELDHMCDGRLPTIKDTPKLPVLRATIRESMRWRPSVPTGVAHETEADQFYNGYFIPKNTRLLPCDWAIQRDPAKYPDPESFRPERWLVSSWPTYREPLTQFPTIKNMTGFGWGQRQCLGMALVQDEMVVACSALLWCFNLRPKTDPVTGLAKPVPTSAHNSLLIIKPDPFEMYLEPRSRERTAEALALWAEAEAQDKARRAALLHPARAVDAKPPFHHHIDDGAQEMIAISVGA